MLLLNRLHWHVSRFRIKNQPSYHYSPSPWLPVATLTCVYSLKEAVGAADKDEQGFHSALRIISMRQSPEEQCEGNVNGHDMQIKASLEGFNRTLRFCRSSLRGEVSGTDSFILTAPGHPLFFSVWGQRRTFIYHAHITLRSYICCSKERFCSLQMLS